ncbi:MAG: hypothetical protein Q9160_005262 [Pyrenula sp. 1 TL-2023]
MASQETVLITGCSDGGIGSALALIFQQRGFQVFATARDPSKMSKLRDLLNVTLLTLDVVNQSDIGTCVEAVSKQTGGTLNYFISNAAQNHFMPILDENLDEIMTLFKVNCVAPIALTQAFAPLLIKAKGMAVFEGAYAASKRSIEIIAETLRLELSLFGVDVLELVTGAVKSMGHSYFEDFKLPEGSMYQSIEGTNTSRAQGNDDLQRMDTMEYATVAVDEITKRTTGRFWYGTNAESVKMGTTATTVPQCVMVSLT